MLDRTIKNLQAFASEHGLELPALVVEVGIDHDMAKARVAIRAENGGHGVSDEAFARFIDDYTSFSNYGYETISVDGDADVSTNASIIISAVESSRKV